jgi:ABC-type multidrug transport system ATPase subunit
LIALEAIAARHASLALSKISLTWGPGVHALVGASADGGPLLLALIAGAARPRAGRVRVLDGAPTDPAVRAHLAFVPLERALPQGMRVAEVLEIAAVIRGDPPQNAAERLGALGIQPLATRSVETLSREEARAVAIAEAVTSRGVRVLLIEEPLVSLDPRAASRLPEVLRARSLAGTAVVVATASVRDAQELADDCVVLRAGAVVGRAPSLDLFAGLSGTSGTPGDGARLRIWSSDPRALAAALAREERVEAVARRDASVTVRGRDPVELARAAGRAVVASGVALREIRVETPSLREARAALANTVARTAVEWKA